MPATAVSATLAVTAARTIRTHDGWRRTSTTLERLAARCEDPFTGPKDEAPAVVLGTLDGPVRGRDHVTSRTALALDSDEPPPGLLDAVRSLGVAFLAWKTASSSPGAPRWRVVVPLSEPVGPAEHDALARAVCGAAGGSDAWDSTCAQASRAVYLPTSPSGDQVEHVLVDGPALDVKAWLATAELDEPAAPDRPRVRQDPRSLPGAVGAYNRLRSVADVVEEWALPFEPTGDPHMWRLLGSHGTGGLHEVAPGWWHDHHATSPTCGRTMSLWDIVRLHVWGGLDADLPADAPPTDAPSHRKALEVIGALPDVQAEMAAAVLGPVPADDVGGPTGVPGPEDDGEWRTRLARKSSSGEMRDVAANWDVVAEHDPVLLSIGSDEMGGDVVWLRPPPWRPDAVGAARRMSDGDYWELTLHLERSLGASRPPLNVVTGLVAQAAQRRAVHPVRTWLDGLEWDGVKRLERCLPGAADEEWTSLALRRCMVSAVARVMDPGCKVDLSLVLVGGEGVGKTWWIERMSRGWHAILGPVHRPDTLAIAHRAWIVVDDECAGRTASDAEELKSWLTRREDTWRAPYARAAVTRRRSFVVWGTTNDRAFLRREDGNRRYVPVSINGAMDVASLTGEYVSQVWAEAVALYRAGEPTWLSQEEAELSILVRDEFTEEDSLEGEIRAYVDRLVPSQWEGWTTAQRRAWLDDVAMDLVSPGEEGDHLMMNVSTAQVYADLITPDRSRRERGLERRVRRILRTMPGWGPGPLLRQADLGPQRCRSRLA